MFHSFDQKMGKVFVIIKEEVKGMLYWKLEVITNRYDEKLKDIRCLLEALLSYCASFYW